MSFEALSEMLQVQADACDRFGAPFTAKLTRCIKDDLDAGGPVRSLFEPWAEARRRTIINDAAPIRLLGALHDLALSGEAPSLAAHYPDLGKADTRAAWAEARRLIPQRTAQFIRFMSHEPQTNEVGRSACLLGGFLTIAERTRLPLRIFELGASAGLNQLWDRFHYTLGAATWGDDRSPVRLSPGWKGGLPPLTTPAVVLERCACDRRAVDISDPLQRRRLSAYIWPDMAERLPRLRAAIDLALDAGVRVEQADAVDFARRAAPAPGAVSVLFHSIFFQYMPRDSQVALEQGIVAYGAAATPEAPFAWLRMEPPPANMAGAEVRLTLWPTGDELLLADVHPHGAWVKWRG